MAASPADEPAGSLEELASFAAAQLCRHGDELVVEPDVDGDPTWFEQATAFWLGLGELVDDGRVEVEGADGCTWSYEFTPRGVVQRETNGWDGSGDGPGRPDEDEELPWQAPEDPAAGPRPPLPRVRCDRVRRRRGPAGHRQRGMFPLAVGTFHLLVGWRLSRPR